MENKNQSRKSIIIKALTEGDIPAAASLHERLIPSAGARMGQKYLRAFYATLLHSPTIHAVLGAYRRKRLIGIVSATRNPTKTDQMMNLRLLFLLPTLLGGLIRGRWLPTDLLCHWLVQREIKKASNRNTAYILTIAVDPAFQRTGIATRLVRKAVNILKPQTLFVDTLKINQRAQKFYTNAGFAAIKSVADSIIFRKNISGIPSAFP